MQQQRPRTGATVVILAIAVILIWVVVHAFEPQGPRAVTAGQVAAANPSQEQVNEALGLRASATAPLALLRGTGGSLSAVIPLGAEPGTLDLRPHSVRAANYRVKVQQADGTFTFAEPSPVRTYRGRVRELEGSQVAATMEDDGLHARIMLADGTEFWVEPLRGRFANSQRDAHVVYRGEDVIPTTATCDAHDGMRIQLEQMVVSNASLAGCGTGMCVAETAFDADVEYFQSKGSVSAVEDRINSVINAVNLQYETQVGIRHAITTIIVRSAEPDPYSATESSMLLTQFRSEWLNNQGDVQRDLAQLFTGRDMAGGTIGIAWLEAVCSSFGFSVVQSDFNGNFSCATDLTAHEFGHNWDAGHCDCGGTPGYTMNPFITCANDFHPTFTIPVIESYRDASACLDPATLCQLDTECDDGLFCNGAETCGAGVCGAGIDPCPGEDCDEALSGCVPLVCNNDGQCDIGENCQNCPNDCISGSGAVCGNTVCEIGAGENCSNCPEDCNSKLNGRPQGRFCCGDIGAGSIFCGDLRCWESGNTCTESPGTVSCCGDGFCEGTEDIANCAVDCAVPCSLDLECDDADPCTVDACNAGFCRNDEMSCDDQDACTADDCVAGVCFNDPIVCFDGDACSVDSCDSASGCVFTFPDCGALDGCCGPTCTAGDDPDCSCAAKNAACSSGADCCSGSCKPNGRCR